MYFLRVNNFYNTKRQNTVGIPVEKMDKMYKSLVLIFILQEKIIKTAKIFHPIVKLQILLLE